MKKYLILLMVAILVSCGPSKSEREEAEKRKQDSIDLLIEKARIEGSQQVVEQPKIRKKFKEETEISETVNLRNDLNGQLLKTPNKPEVYWIDEGKRRHIQSSQILDAYFIGKNVAIYPDLNLVPLGSPITALNKLIRCTSPNSSISGYVYFLDNGKKRHIVSEGSFKSNNFKWSGIREIDCSVLKSIPTGDPIE